MNKYEILTDKLERLSRHIDSMNVHGEATSKQLVRLKNYVDELISDVKNKTIRNSDGARLGLMQGISDYYELEGDEVLWDLVLDADLYYANECRIF